MENLKTITVSEELYKKLLTLSVNINTQDHRATAMPYFFQVMTKKRVWVPDGCGNECWVSEDGETTLDTEEEINEAIAEYLEKNISEIEKMPSCEKEPFLERMRYDKMNYDYIDVYENAFLTEKSCKEHIQANKYHYSEPRDFLTHAFRNPDLETVYEFLCGLQGKDIHK